MLSVSMTVVCITSPAMAYFFFNWQDSFELLLLMSLLLSQGLYQGGVVYHLAINGKSFAVLCDHFPEYLPKVMETV